MSYYDFMAKRTQRRKQPSSTVSGAKTHYEGLGYFIPHGYTLEQIQKLASEWNKKLQNANHEDIEHFSDVLPGLSSPYLRNHRSYKCLESHLDPSEAFSLIQTYYNYYLGTTQARYRFGERYLAAKFLISCYINQVKFRTIAAIANGSPLKSFKLKYPEVEFPTYFDVTSMPKSHYWAYEFTRKILQHCWLWHITDINGELTIETLNQFEFVGMDVKGTQAFFDLEHKKLGLEPVKLKKPESKY